MTNTEIAVSSLLGRKVRDRAGKYVGRLVEIEASIVLLEGRSEYVASMYHVSHYGAFDWMAGSILVQQLVERLGERFGYRCRHVLVADLPLTGAAELKLTA